MRFSRLALLLIVALAYAAVPASAGVITYAGDYAGWRAAALHYGPIATESFEVAALNPGLSITGPSVHIPYLETGTNCVQPYSDYPCVFMGANVMRDIIDETYNPTGFQLNHPTHSFGGYFDLKGPAGPGSGINVSASDGVGSIGHLDSLTYGTFWGFVSTDAFTTVIFSENSPGTIETYDLDDLQYNVPEPSTLLMALAGFGLLASKRR